jgi:Brp/Blh family beta-carotene 15,15'-monooxygenase
MSMLRLQGLVFSCGAILLAAMAATLGQLGSQIELLVIASLILVLGVPHGALDTIFARQIYGILNLRGWIYFGSIYLLLSALVVGVWFLQPAIFLLAFLVISAFHFSGDPVEGTPWPARAFYGGAVVILPAALHTVETTRLFSLLAGENAAALVMPWLALLSWPWLVGLILAAIQRARKDWLTALELFSVGILSVIAPPLLSFTLFFCAMHSARHILRTIDYSAQSSRFFILGAALLPMFGVLAASLLAWHFLGSTPIDARIVQIVFVGLAALTVPHMALVERVRLAGWVNPKKPRHCRFDGDQCK